MNLMEFVNAFEQDNEKKWLKQQRSIALRVRNTLRLCGLAYAENGIASTLDNYTITVLKYREWLPPQCPFSDLDWSEVKYHWTDESDDSFYWVVVHNRWRTAGISRIHNRYLERHQLKLSLIEAISKAQRPKNWMGEEVAS